MRRAVFPETNMKNAERRRWDDACGVTDVIRKRSGILCRGNCENEIRSLTVRVRYCALAERRTRNNKEEDRHEDCP